MSTSKPSLKESTLKMILIKISSWFLALSASNMKISLCMPCVEVNADFYIVNESNLRSCCFWQTDHTNLIYLTFTQTYTYPTALKNCIIKIEF
jgi:hypothetical protein